MSAYPEEKIQGVLNGSQREGFLSPRQVNGQVVELFALCYHFPTARFQVDRTVKQQNMYSEALSCAPES